MRFIEADINKDQFDDLLELLLYHGVLGVIIDNEPKFIYHFQYDLKRLQKKLENASADERYAINPALEAEGRELILGICIIFIDFIRWIILKEMIRNDEEKSVFI